MRRLVVKRPLPLEWRRLWRNDLTYPLLEEREMEKTIAKIEKEIMIYNSSVGAEGGYKN